MPDASAEKAIRDELTVLAKRKIKGALLEASKAPLFLADMEEIEKDFLFSDFEKAEK